MLNKTIKKLLFLGILTFCATLIYSIIWTSDLRNLDTVLIEKLLNQNKTSKTELSALQTKLKECQKYNVFQQAVSEIGDRKYSEKYDCYDHSKDLQKALKELNIESSIFINDGKNHVWVGVWIEAVDGHFIELDHKYKILEVK